MKRGESLGPRIGDLPCVPNWVLLTGAGLVYILSMGSLLLFGEIWRVFQIAHGVWYASFLAIVFLILRSGSMDRTGKDTWKMALALFVVSGAMRLLFLAREPALSQDIWLLEGRGEKMLDGQFPYVDFQPNKPPLYIWMVGGLSLLFGPHQAMFRIVFSMIDACIPVVMVLIARDMISNPPASKMKGLPAFGFAGGALIYAICPVPILEVGWAGHFDPVVVLTTLLAFWALLRSKPIVSGIMLGAGLSLKLYPLFLIPILALALERWKDRFRLGFSSLIVPIVSSIPLLIVDPGGILGYFEYQTLGWYSGTGLRTVLDAALDAFGLPAGIGFFLMTGLLIAGYFFIVMKGSLHGLGRKDLDFISVIAGANALLLLAITYVMVLTLTGTLLGWGVGILIVLTSILYLISFVIVYSMGPKTKGKRAMPGLQELIRARIPIREVPFVSSAALLLLILVSAQFHPWYLIWIIPFLSGSPAFWSWSILILFGSYQSDFYIPRDVGSF